MENPSLNELYARGYYAYSAHALMRASNPSTGKVYLAYQALEVESKLLIKLCENKKDVDAVAQSELTLKYNERFKTFLNENPSVKQLIGKTVVQIDFIDFKVKVFKDKIYPNLKTNDYTDLRRSKEPLSTGAYS